MARSHKAGPSRRRTSEPLPDEAVDHLRQLLDVPGYAIVSADGEGRITLFNRGAEDLFVWTAGEMVDGAVATLFPGGLPNTVPPARGDFHDVVGRRKDGSEFVAEVAVSRLKTDGGWTAVLRQARKDDQAIFENAGIGFYRTSLGGRPLRVNPAFVAMMGYNGEDDLLAAKKDIAAEWYVDPARRAEFRRLVEENGHLADFESEACRYATGERIWVSETARVVRDSDGRPLYYEGTVLDITERKRAEKALSDSESRLRAILDNSSVEITLKDLAGRYLLVNRAWRENHGLTLEEAVGRTLAELHSEEKAAPFTAMELRVIETGEAVEREVQPIVAPNGEAFVSIKFPVRDEAGRIISVGTINTDISDINRAVAALRESEERYRSLVEKSPDGIFVHVDDTITYVNAAAVGLFAAKSPRDLIGKEAFDLMGPSFRDLARDRVRQMKEGQEIPFVEARLLRLDGSEFDGEVAGTTFLHGGKTAIQTIVRDVSKRKQAQDALRESEAHNRAILNSVLDGIITIDDEGTIISFNAAAEGLFGFAAKEAVGRNVKMLMPEPEHGEHDGYISNFLETGEAGIIGIGREVVAKRKDGTFFPMDLGITELTMAGRRLFVGVTRDITERKLAQEALRESEERFRAVVESSPGAVIIKDLDLRNVIVNKRLGDWYGTDAEAIIGKSVHAFLPKEIADRVEAQERKVIKSGTVVEEERTVTYPDGVTRHVLAQKFPIPGPNGECVAVGTVINDITERKRAQEALGRSEERFRAVVESSPGAVIIKDLDLRNVIVNKRLGDWYGTDAEAIIGKSVHAFLPKEIADRVEAQERKVIKSGTVVEEERTVTYPDGVTRHVLAQKFPIPGPNGECVAVGTVINDITERKRAQEALSESEERFRSLVNNMTDSVFVFDLEGGYRMVNSIASQALGYSEAELLDLTVADIAVDKTLEERQKGWQRLGPGGSLTVEARHQRKDGSIIPVEVKVNEFQAGDDRLIMAVARDITERQRAEEQLRLAKDEAETANRAKSEFLSSMSHELRTPMNAILGFGQLLQIDTKEPLGDNHRDYVDAILKGGEHLLELINDVLDLSVIEAGKIDLAYESVAPADVADECVSLARMMADKRGITITDRCDCAPTSWAWADRTRLKQILLNLLSNAIKYNRDGGSVTLDCRPTADGMLRFLVDDTGIGIPAERRDELFLPFSRLGAEKSAIDGTGIGLALCKRLVELMDGRIGFESRAGEGSTFWIELPLAAGEEDSPPPRAAEPGPAAAGEWCVLYVEDNPADVHLMEAIVARLPDVALVSAHNAELALEMAEFHGPAVIIMDINLPGMDGIEALKRLRRSAATRDTPVIAVSSNAAKTDVENYLAAGFRDFLPKPIRIDTALALLDQALNADC